MRANTRGINQIGGDVRRSEGAMVLSRRALDAADKCCKRVRPSRELNPVGLIPVNVKSNELKFVKRDRHWKLFTSNRPVQALITRLWRRV